MARRLLVVLAAITLASSAARAGMLSSDPQAAGFSPLVPISAFARPAAWFDPSRLHFTSSFAVGSGFGSAGTNMLQTTSLSYQFKAPVWMSVSLGNAYGPDAAKNGSFFLQGLDLSWRPSSNSMFRLSFQDVRSPLQYGYGYGYAYGPWGPTSGVAGAPAELH